MATKAQISANRRNAQLSTGPKTAEGKAKAAKNAQKHGIFSIQTVIKGENQAEFEQFREQMLAELVPEGITESVLAGRIVNLSWRLKRLEHIQNQAFDVMIERDEPSPMTKYQNSLMTKELREAQDDKRGSDPELLLGRVAIEDLSNSRVMERLSLYERRIENSMFKTMKELKKLQFLRKAEQAQSAKAQAVPLPILGVPMADMRHGEPAFSRFENKNAAYSRTKRNKKINYAKQSQFRPEQNNLSSFERKEYELLTSRTQRQNKANPSTSLRTGQRQISNGLTPVSFQSKRDCHVPSGMAMTFREGFNQNVTEAEKKMCGARSY